MNRNVFVRVHEQSLSLWQSAVAETVKKQMLSTNDAVASTSQILQHPLVQATNAHVSALINNTDFDASRLDLTHPYAQNTYLSQLGHQIGMSMAENDEARVATLTSLYESTYRSFSDKDPGFIGCAATYASYYKQSGGIMVYNDWTVVGKNNINFGVIDYKLPNNAVVGILGDWGTGLDDARALLYDLMVQHKPQAIIHLGDIYYSGTPSECQDTFTNLFETVFDQVLGKGNRIPVFTIPGNHDYYAWGMGFYPMLNQLNKGMATAKQEASYFCLRTEDNAWQFLAMDTGYNDSNPADQIDPTYAGPALQPTEVTWHTDKMMNFKGSTILLSHHQLFSANSKLNGMASAYKNLVYLNPFLYKTFWNFLPTSIAGWIWGHEHNMAMYRNNLFGLSKGRLIGSSAFEEITSSDPYTVNYPQVPYLFPAPQNQLHTNSDIDGNSYYNHSYAIIDFSVRKQPLDPVNISYYEFPSWGDVAPVNPASNLIFTEQFVYPGSTQQPVVQSGDRLCFFGQESLYISVIYQQIQNYPTLNTSGPVALTLSKNNGGALNDGDVISISTTESAAGSYNILGAWSTPTLYYYSSGYKQEQWTIKKKDTSKGREIHYGDDLYFVNNYYSGQWLCSYFSRVYGGTYLTTKAGSNYYWRLMPTI